MENENRKSETKKSIFKRWWFWTVLILIIIIAAIGSNGGKKDSDGSKTASGGNTSDGTEQTAGDTEDVTGTPAESSDVTIEEQVLAEQNGIKVTATGLGSSIYGPCLKVKVENTGTSTVTVQADSVAVNGIMLGTAVFSCDVAAGKTANDEIDFMESQLKAAGIETIGNIELKIRAFDSASLSTLFTTDLQNVATSAAGTFEQSYDDTGFVAVDQDGYKIVIKKLDNENSFWGADIYLYIENNTENDITVQAADVSINGIMVDPAFSCSVLAGKKAFGTMTFFESDLSDNNITDITGMELKFNIFNSSNFQTLLQTDTVNAEFNEE